MKKFVTIIGTRPQLIKYDRELKQKLVWTGQHYDKLLSNVFFKGLKIPRPDYVLAQTELGAMIDGITPILKKEQPDYVIVYGDCRTTLAGAMAAHYMNIPIIHIEAGCRSYNDSMIEERIRIAVDNLSSVFFTSSEKAKDLLISQGKARVFFVGATQIDTMFSIFPTKKPKDAYKYRIMTLHRDFNIESKSSLENIMGGVSKSDMSIELYTHPHTKKNLKKFNIAIPKNVSIKRPLGYKQMINRMAFADKVITDSGGLQVEAFVLRRPCITLRNDTEWTETVEQGWNILVSPDGIGEYINKTWRGKGDWQVYGVAQAKKNIRIYLENL